MSHPVRTLRPYLPFSIQLRAVLCCFLLFPGSITRVLSLLFPAGTEEEQLSGCLDWEKRPPEINLQPFLLCSFPPAPSFESWLVPPIPEPSNYFWMQAGLLLLSFPLCGHYPLCQDSTQSPHSSCIVDISCLVSLSLHFFFVFVGLYLFFAFILVGLGEGAEIIGHNLPRLSTSLRPAHFSL